MSFLYVFFISILIGTANILPGISGGVIAIIFGIYDKIIFSLNNFFKNFKKNFIFLLVVFVGVVIGMLLFSNILLMLFKNNEFITKCIFIGAILGGIPCLSSMIKKKTCKDMNFFLTFISLLLTIFSFYIIKYNINFNIVFDNKNIIVLFLFVGFIYSAGKVIPGISGSLVLILFNQYEYILKLISNPFSVSSNDLIKLIPFLIGFILGCLFFIKLMNILLKYKFRNTYSVIIGIILGSIPGFQLCFDSVYDFLIALIIIILTGFLTSKITKTE